MRSAIQLNFPGPALRERLVTLRKSPTAESLDFGPRVTAGDFRVNPMTAIGNMRGRLLLVGS